MSHLTTVTLCWSQTSSQSAAVKDTWTAIISKKLAAGSRNKGSRPWREEPRKYPPTGPGFSSAFPQRCTASPVRRAGFMWGGGNLASWELRPGCFSRKTSCRGVAVSEVTHGSCFCSHALTHTNTHTAKKTFIVKTPVFAFETFCELQP